GDFLITYDPATLPVTASGDLVETSYPAGTDPSAVIALSATERFGGADFGYLPASGTAVLGDRVWYDADGNGLQDPGELGIGGVEIQLLGPGCDPTPCTVTTEPDGSWLVTGLAPGDFLITYDPATLPAGYNTIPTNLEPDDTYGITVAANDVMTQLDFGFDGGTTGTIGDRVWLDEDGDGAQDAGEPGLAGVTVNLLDSSGNIIATTTTAADGSYLFSGVPDGDYTVSLSDIDGVLVGLPQSYDPDEAGVCTTCDKQGSVSVSGGVSTPADVDFGFAPSGGTGTIGDFVWHDADGDGVQDPGESGIQGVTLELWLDVNGDGVITPGLDNLVRNAVTDQNGEYQFSSLPDEDYVVRVTDTAGVVSAFVQTGDPDEAGTCTVCDGQGVLSLAGGSGDFGQDFGYAAPAGQAYVISGTVFDDESRDGIFDDPAESGVEAALVMLFNDLNGDGVLDPDEPLIGSTVTDADGNYSLADLPPGDYLVAVDTSGTTVDGYLQSTQTATAGLQPVEITTANVADQDFGFWSGGPTTTPVTLAYFGSEGGGNVTFEWATATETGNLGFHLYVLAEDGMRRLNETLIPSQLGDALAPQRYALEAWGVDGDQFLLEDVDLYGQTRYHGPFELGRTYGNQVWNVKRTDWVGIRREHHRKAAARRSRRLAGLGGGSSMGSRPALGRAAPVYLRVREDGLYRVTYEALVAAGVDLAGFPASKLALLEGGQPVPIRVGGPGRFGPGSFVEFVGRGLDTLYTDTNVYTLKVAPKYAARVGHDAGLPSTSARIPGFYYETRTAEFNRAYDFAAPGDDPWYDTRLLAISGPVEAFFELELEDRLPEAGPVELTVELWGVTDFPQAPDHHVVLEVNGVELADEWFDGFEDRAVRTEIPDWLLGPDSNRLRVLLPHDTGALYDLVNYDHYRLRFPRRFEAIGGQLRFSAAAEAFRVEGLPSADVVVYRVTQEGVEILEAVQISSLAGAYSATFTGSQREATYYVSTVEALQMPLAEPAPPRKPILDAEAEMLIIAHPDFVDSLDPLVAARRLEGLSVQVVNVEELYRRFSHGVFDPRAIRTFVRRAYRDSGARYVLLVGGDTYDYFDYLGGGAVSFLPTLYTQTDPIVRFAPVDPLYGDINSDGVPEVAVGRWPVRTTAELEAILDRTLRYADIDYVRTAVFSADAYDAPAGYSFSAASEEMLGYLPETWQAERVYLDELPLEEA
ncbi:MAG: SdrD B-like domain-containing protein, partial [Thermoanaerobaculia bacterium]